MDFDEGRIFCIRNLSGTASENQLFTRLKASKGFEAGFLYSPSGIADLFGGDADDAFSAIVPPHEIIAYSKPRIHAESTNQKGGM